MLQPHLSTSTEPQPAAAPTTLRMVSGARGLRPRKARTASECEELEQLPNIGPSIAADLRLLGVKHPQDLATRDAFVLYQALCAATGKRQDPCVLDTFLSATDFMRGADARPWWAYTAERKAVYGTL
jgi:hypothetical protein